MTDPIGEYLHRELTPASSKKRPAYKAADAVRAMVAEELRVDSLRELLRGFVEPENRPCSFDHHGYCQEHGWFDDVPGRCGVREARQLLGLDDR